MITTVRQRNAKWLWNILRRNCLLCNIIEGKLEANNTAGGGRQDTNIRHY